MGRAVRLILLTLVLVLAGPAPAFAGEGEGQVSRSAYLARQLAENPVYVSDQVPRAVPRSAAPLFARAAARLDVPTYLMVLPSDGLGVNDEALLASVHDRLGKDGVYVVLGEDGIYGAAAAYGVRASAGEAMRAAQYELPGDAGAVAAFDRFVEVLDSGEAAARADAAARAYRRGEDPADRYPSRTDRNNQSFVTGALMSGSALAVVLCGWHVVRRGERRRDGTAAAPRERRTDLSTSPSSSGRSAARGPSPVRPARRRPTPRVALVLAGAVTATLVGVGGHVVCDETRSDAGPPPTAQDLRARVERVAAGLRESPFYADPESPAVFDAAEQRQLRDRLAELDVPVYVAALPVVTEDACAGDERLLAERLHDELGQDGVFVVADSTGSGRITVSNYGARLDEAALYRLPDEVENSTEAVWEAEDRLLPERLTALFAHIEKAPQGPPGEPYYDPEPAPDAAAEDLLPPLVSEDFWPGLTVIGPLAAVLLLGVTAVVLGLAGLRSPTRAGAAAGARTSTGGARGTTAGPPSPGSGAPAPDRPTPGWLRRTLHAELGDLGTVFDAEGPALPADVRKRVWSCLDAARLLVDEDGDHRLDRDADPLELACALTLVRAGAHAARARSVRHADVPCPLNPLHGPATARHRVRLPGAAQATRTPVCAHCRDELASGRPAVDLMLRLPPPDGGSAVRYDELDGPVQLFDTDTEDLVDDIREYLGVH
ncbi:hypothetical protein RM572_17570 [Streptomyces sp. DSM 42041]|uniref:DUF4350 domain-containing protein n=1 Tax=Streptomyces hazeniae TaxID=3075538 RepID=A0ABU2NUB5_9ACTN|nr:hypothetical protein [Streptomyces sp. DSM 42041]MDT0380565.1 hypothetical protein [Streptomyces sp. DSM 42041]